MKTMEWGELSEVVRRAVDEMRTQHVLVTPGRVENVVNAVQGHAVAPADAIAATAKLRAEAVELRVIVDRPTTPWVDRTRAQARLDEIERELAALGPALPGAHQAAVPTGLEAEVRAVLTQKGNERVVAFVDEKRGEVRSFLLPTPPAGQAPAWPDKMSKPVPR